MRYFLRMINHFFQLFGQTTEEKYPYASGYYGITEDCEFNVADTPPVVGITGYDTIYNDQVCLIYDKHIFLSF